MGKFLQPRLHGSVRVRCLPGFALALACGAAAGPEPAPKPAIKVDERRAPGIVYFEESGGLLVPLMKPDAGSARKPLPPFPPGGAKLPLRPSREVKRPQPPSLPGSGADRPQLAKKPAKPAVLPGLAHAPPTPAEVASSPEVLQREVRQKYDALILTLFDVTAPALERARRIEAIAGAQVESFRDAPAAIRLGWLWLDAQQPDSATAWFERARNWRVGDEEATRGLAFAALAQGRFLDVVKLAAELPAGSPERATLERDGWVGIAQAEYEAGQYDAALTAFERASAAGALPRYASMLRAWSLLRTGSNSGAADEFSRLYSAAPDLAAAQGVLAAIPAGRLPVDSLLASTEPLATLVRRREGEAAFQRRRYLEARELDPSRWGSVGSPGVVSALGAFGRREKTGEDGLGRLIVTAAPSAGLYLPLGPREVVSLALDRFRLDAGQMLPTAPFGSAAEGAITAAGEYALRKTVREPRVSLRVERDVVIVASVGNGVSGGAVAARPVGSIALFAAPAWGQAEARAFIEPVRESVLSWAGMADPQSGAAWGGVRRVGAEAHALYLGNAPYSAGIRVRAERLIGTDVADNKRQALEVSAGRDLGLKGFSYASLGLTASVDNYRRNLSHFTLGHGGYFSPQSYRKAGVAFDFMTSEGGRWLARGRVNAARTWKREDAVAYLPLAPDGRDFAGSNSIGHEAGVRVSAVAQLTPHVQAGLAIGRSVSPQFSEKFALLQLRILFAPRRGVVSADLPLVSGE